MLLFWNLFGSNQNLCVLKQNLLHLSNNYVIKPIIMCARNNIFLPTSRCYSMMTKLCCFAAILRWFHHITKLRVPNIDSIIFFRFDIFLWYQLPMNAGNTFSGTDTCIHDFTNRRYNQSINSH